MNKRYFLFAFLLVNLVMLFSGLANVYFRHGLLTKEDKSDVEYYSSALKDNYNSWIDIFRNNVLAFLMGTVPIFGSAMLLYILYNTGRVLALISIASNISIVYLDVAMLITPFYWLEMLSYSISVYITFLSISNAIKRESLKAKIIEPVRTWISSWKLVVAGIAILLIGSLIEIVFIQWL